jgi:hypothetical protein
MVIQERPSPPRPPNRPVVVRPARRRLEAPATIRGGTSQTTSMLPNGRMSRPSTYPSTGSRGSGRSGSARRPRRRGRPASRTRARADRGSKVHRVNVTPDRRGPRLQPPPATVHELGARSHPDRGSSARRWHGRRRAARPHLDQRSSGLNSWTGKRSVTCSPG